MNVYRHSKHGLTTSTPLMDRMIRAGYMKFPVKTLCRMLGKSNCFLRIRMKQLGLVVPVDVIARRRKESQFKLGLVPVNKGQKMSAEMYKLCEPTMFKPGNVPGNTKPVGYERTNVDGYVEVRMAERVAGKRTFFKLKQRLLWEAAHGKIPEGCNIIFRDGIKLNIVESNLECVSNEGLMGLNSIQRFPPELIRVVRLNGRLKRMIAKMEDDE